MRASSFVAVALVLLFLGGCVSTPTPDADGVQGPMPCEHPYPCGNEWPTSLEGPFPIKQILDLKLPSHDRAQLETYVFLPTVPEGVRVPVVLWSTPYPGSCASNAAACFQPGDNPQSSTRIDVRKVVERGYAVAVANVRGTGNSGGCFEDGGINEQKDQAFLVQWLAEQAWSNGRVAMYGHSYPSYTAWMGAVQNPPALKTVIVSGLMNDRYTTVYTPQGAAAQDGGWFNAGYASSLGLVPPLGGPPEHWTVEHAPVMAQRACPGLVDTTAETQRGHAVDQRNEAHWKERRLISRIPDVQAAVLVVSGYEDSAILFHAFQDDDVWTTLKEAPKRFIMGHWGHALPPPSKNLQKAPFGADWYEHTLFHWLDYWLKGVGTEPRLGLVDYEDSSGEWNTTTSWPPADQRAEVLYLADKKLLPAQGPSSHTMRPTPGRFVPICSTTSQVFATAKMTEAVQIAGNPFAYLRLTADQPGGIVALDLYDLGPNYRCDETSTVGATWLAAGAADLRFHDGVLKGRDFPTARPTMVRVDINNQAWTIGAGHQLALVVSGAGFHARAGQPFTPQITIHADGGDMASHLVVPIVNGTFGGGSPTVAYPPRPFLPRDDSG